METNLELAKLLERGILTLIYGPPASGKTTLCLQAAINCAKKGEKIYFIDTENGFSTERVNQLGGILFLENIMVNKVYDFKKQCLLSKKLLGIRDADLVIIDSATMNYREAIHKKFDANPWMSKHLSELKELAKKGASVILTSQIYSKMDGTIEAVGSNMLKNWCDCVVKLDITQNKRFMTLEKHTSISNKSFEFTIKNEGIVLNA